MKAYPNDRVYTDNDGRIWYDRGDGSLPELLTDEDDVCGVWIAATGPCDWFRPACRVHDNLYVKRDFFEARGWTRQRMDDYFLKLMLARASESNVPKAYFYYALVRMFGWYPYSKHQLYRPPIAFKM